MNGRNIRILRLALSAVLLALLLTGGIYAWIVGDTAPELQGNMRVGNNAGLILQIDPESEELIDADSLYFGLGTRSMNLNELSSVDGSSFYKRVTDSYFTDRQGQEILTFTQEAVKNSISGDILDGDYLELSFTLSLDYADENAEYYVYFLNGLMNGLAYETGFALPEESTESTEGLRALRARLEVSGADAYGSVLSGEDHSALFANAAENEEAGYFTEAVKSTGTVLLPLDSDSQTSHEICRTLEGICYGETAGQELHAFSDCAVSAEGGLRGTELPSENYLFRLKAANGTVRLTLRVWLEGGSAFCTNDKITPDEALSLNLYFVAYEVKNE